jgi:hypothetical protein
MSIRVLGLCLMLSASGPRSHEADRSSRVTPSSALKEVAMPLGHSKPGVFHRSALLVTLLLAAILASLPWLLGPPTPAWAASPWQGPAEPSPRGWR